MRALADVHPIRLAVSLSFGYKGALSPLYAFPPTSHRLFPISTTIFPPLLSSLARARAATFRLFYSFPSSTRLVAPSKGVSSSRSPKKSFSTSCSPPLFASQPPCRRDFSILSDPLPSPPRRLLSLAESKTRSQLFLDLSSAAPDARQLLRDCLGACRRRGRRELGNRMGCALSRTNCHVRESPFQITVRAIAQTLRSTFEASALLRGES